MAVIHDMIPDFELYQPENLAGALEVLDRHRDKAWVLAGGMDTFDWLKDRVKRPEAVVDLGASRSCPASAKQAEALRSAP